MTLKNRKPKGTEEVKEAILNTASRLFAQRGVAAVSIRDIGQEASVNHGLITRHFGTKEKLRLAVQNRLMENINKDIGEFSSLNDAMIKGVEAMKKNEEFWKVLARTLLDGTPDGDIQNIFPFMEKINKLIKEEQNNGSISQSIDSKILVAGGIALIYGLFVFEDYILPAVGLPDKKNKDVKDKIIHSWLSMMIQ